jgi:hypothetical protein
MIIKLKAPNAGYPDLSEGQAYFVIGIEADDFRILNDAGRPYLYPADLFIIVDSTEPKDWVGELGDDGERYAYPPQLSRPGFFEDLFDHDANATSTFWHTVNQKLSNAA